MTQRTRPQWLRAAAAFALMLPGIQDVSAARIYNFTNQFVEVKGLSKQGWNITLKAGEKSDSINSGAHTVVVYHPFAVSLSNPEVCRIASNGAISGGNYLIIVQQGDKIGCTLCDAGRKATHQAQGTLKKGYEYSTPKKPLHGCE